jgi:hypothetical protein
MKMDEILELLKRTRTRDHIVLFYTDTEDRDKVLSAFLKAGLDKGEAVSYICSEQSPEQTKQSLQAFGIDAEKYERNGALKIIDYSECFIINGKFNPSKTMSFLKNLVAESGRKGFRGLRVAEELACFFNSKMMDELIEYELALHTKLRLPMTAISAYNQQLITEIGGTEADKLLFEVLRAHSTALIMGPGAIIVKTVIK